MANLSGAELLTTFLGDADLRGANLSGAYLHEADLRGTDLHGATLFETIIANVDLSNCKSVESVRHAGPNTVDVRTLQRSGHLPLLFLRGVGLPDKLIEYLPSLLNQAIQHYSCFICYNHTDISFARRLEDQL